MISKYIFCVDILGEVNQNDKKVSRFMKVATIVQDWRLGASEAPTSITHILRAEIAQRIDAQI